MSRGIRWCVGLRWLAVVLAAGLNSRASGESMLRFEVPVATHTAVPGESYFEYVFKGYNAGLEPVVIREIKSSCACTVGEPSSRVVQPNESFSLSARFNYGARVGKQEKPIRLHVSDSKDPITLTLAVEIPEWIVGKSMVEWSREEWSSGRTKDFHLKIRSTPFEVVGIEGSGDFLRADVHPDDDGVSISVTPMVPVEQVGRMIRLRLDVRLEIDGKPEGIVVSKWLYALVAMQP